MLPSPPRAAVAALLLCGSLAACDGPACGTYPVCDIREASCQAAVWAEAQCARDVAGEPIPPVRVIDEATFRAEVEAGVAAYVPTADDEHLDRALDLLGLIDADAPPETYVDARVAAVAAYYSSRDEAITVVDRGAMDDTRDVIVLQHEMIHALQDRAHDLEAFFAAATTHDERLARSMIVEGEAAAHQYLYRVGTIDLAPHDTDWESFYDAWLVEVRRLHWTEERYAIGSGGLIYPLGGRAMTHAWLEDPDAPRRAFDDPPTSTVSFLYDPFLGHPAPITEGTRLCDAAAIPPGTRLVRADTFGATMVYAFLAVGGFEREAWQLARAWEGDRITVVGTDDGMHTAVMWRLRVRDDETLPDLRARTAWFWDQPLRGAVDEGADLVLVASDDAGLFEAWSGVAAAGCP